MRILKPGVIPADLEVLCIEYECPICGCIFEAVNGEFYRNGDAGGRTYYGNCPCCHHMVMGTGKVTKRLLKEMEEGK